MEYSSNRTYTSTGARSLDPIWSSLYPSSDIGNVNRLADQWDAWDRRTCARFCAKDGAWYLFQAEGSNPDYEWPGRWVKADDRQLLQATQFLGDRHRQDASGKPEVLGDWAQKSASSSKRRAALAEASGYPSLRVHREDFDQKPHLLLTAEGVVDLRTGDLELQADPRDMLMRMAGVEPHEDPFSIALHVEHGSSPLWDSFLARVQPDPEVRAYLQRLAGYWLTGYTREECFWIFHGENGRNGKGTFLEPLMAAMGEYAGTLPSGSVLNRHPNARPFDLGSIVGKRLVLVSEPPRRGVLTTAFVKDLTGGDVLYAEHKYGHPFNFRPTSKLVIATNHLPKIADRDGAIWRRVRLVPWPVEIGRDEQDVSLKERLKSPEHLPDVLAWAIRGAIAYLERGGLDEPESILRATEQYRIQQDPLGEFLATRTEERPGVVVPTAELYAAWKLWALARDHDPGREQSFGQALTQHGYAKRRARVAGYPNPVNVRDGLALVA